MLYFSTGDDATNYNLRRLDHLASLDRFDDDLERMHTKDMALLYRQKSSPTLAQEADRPRQKFRQAAGPRLK